MAKGRNRHTWTREAAAAAGARGRAAQQLRHKLKPQIAAALEPLPRLPNFHELMLDHTRTRITELLNHLALLTAAPKIDGAQVDRVASAIERLAELERRLDGRPLPGSRRPPRDEPLRPPATRPRGLPPPPARPADPEQQAPPIDDDASDEAPRFTPSEL